MVLLFANGRAVDHVVVETDPPAADARDPLLFHNEDVGSDGDGLLDGQGVSESGTRNRQASDGARLASANARLPFSCPVYTSNETVAARYSKYPGLLQGAMLYSGTGNDLARVLRRAQQMSTNVSDPAQRIVAGDAFRVMVIGGSVSNCRGVDRSVCWHSHLMRWLSDTFPLGAASDRSQVTYRFIDLAKSATGSVFYNYCWQSELVLRRKHTPSFWGKGPDLVIIETGINDVVSVADFTSKKTTQSYQADFRSLLWQMKSLPSRPAVVVLDAASRMLAETQAFHNAAEFTMHLAPSIWLDVPVISGKTALLTPQAERRQFDQDLYLADGHHPNVKGHQVLADLLISHLETIVCQMEDRQDQPPEKEVDTLPWFADVYGASGIANHTGMHHGQCIQVGAAGEKRKPRKNRGWKRLATSRDKQYMASTAPGSKLVYEVTVKEGGQVLLSWLNSKFYNLGEACVTLDEVGPSVRIDGHWSLGWSIGVPTVIFENVSAGIHTVSIEHMRGKTPSAVSNFRLIAIATT